MTTSVKIRSGIYCCSSVLFVLQILAFPVAAATKPKQNGQVADPNVSHSNIEASIASHSIAPRIWSVAWQFVVFYFGIVAFNLCSTKMSQHASVLVKKSRANGQSQCCCWGCFLDIHLVSLWTSQVWELQRLNFLFKRTRTLENSVLGSSSHPHNTETDCCGLRGTKRKFSSKVSRLRENKEFL